MAAALASRPFPAPSAARGVAPVALRVAHPDERAVDQVDLDAAWADATAPHRVADARDAHVADVIPLPTRRTRRALTARMRPTSRGLLFVAGLAMVLALGAGTLMADADGPTELGATVTVQPGQSLWDVAVAHTPVDGDPRATLDRIRDLNGLAGTDVPAWTAVVLPASLD